MAKTLGVGDAPQHDDITSLVIKRVARGADGRSPDRD